MKEFKDCVGIDVSKKTLDVRLYRAKSDNQVTNDEKGFKSLLRWVKSVSKQATQEVLWCFEHTGLYSQALALFLAEAKIPFAMISPLEIKRSLGLVRGKNDRIDAARIAEYAFLRRNKIKTTVLPAKEIRNLKHLCGTRDRMVRQRAGYLTSLKELKHCSVSDSNLFLINVQTKMVADLNKHIKQLEAEIQKEIKSNEAIYRLYQLITSVVGVGPVVASGLIIYTNCFLSFETSRQFACYCGTAPFEKQSGTSLKSKSKVSHMANKKIKALLDLAAKSALQNDPELKLYYQRRLQAGKNKYSTINVVRNKIIYRVFAVVKRETPYVKIYRHAA